MAQSTERHDTSDDGQNGQAFAESGSSDRSSNGKSPLLITGIFGAMGMEFVGATVGGYFLGHVLDSHFDTRPWLALSGVGLGLLASGWHVMRIVKYLMRHENDDETTIPKDNDRD